MRVLLTGAGGFIGSRLLARLRAAGVATRAVSRRPGAALRLADESRVATLTPETDFAALLDGADAVIHLADGFNAWEHLPPAALHDEAEGRLVTTRRLAAAAARRGVRVIYLSTIKAMCGAQAAHVLTEASPARPQSLYGLLKLRAERAIAEAAETHGSRAVILRFPIVFGRGVGGNMQRLFRLAAAPLPLPLAGIDNRRSLISAASLITAVEVIVRQPQGPGGVFLVHDGAMSTPAMFSHVRRALGRPPLLFAVPRGVWRLAGRLPVAGAMAQRLAGDLALDDGRLRAAYGWRPAAPLEEALADWARGGFTGQPL